MKQVLDGENKVRAFTMVARIIVLCEHRMRIERAMMIGVSTKVQAKGEGVDRIFSEAEKAGPSEGVYVLVEVT